MKSEKLKKQINKKFSKPENRKELNAARQEILALVEELYQDMFVYLEPGDFSKQENVYID